jgi:uncharacterized alpha-E superfamily protein
MNNLDALVDELSAVLATERRGLIRHVAASTPHVTKETYNLFAALKRMVEQSDDHARRITEFMHRRELEPKSVTFQPEVANFHFVTLESVLPELIAEKQRQIAAYERTMEHLGADLPDARAELQALLDENRQQLTKLEAAL